jgi:cytosine/uracil/thiamine/allantoin permease
MFGLVKLTRLACYIIDRLDNFYIAFVVAFLLCMGCTPFINLVDSFHPPASEVTEIFPSTQPQ